MPAVIIMFTCVIIPVGDLQSPAAFNLGVEPGTGRRPPFSVSPHWINAGATWEEIERIENSSGGSQGLQSKDFREDRLGTGPSSTCKHWEGPTEVSADGRGDSRGDGKGDGRALEESMVKWVVGHFLFG